MCLGLFIGFIGRDATSGQIRCAMGIDERYDGSDVWAVAVSLFAVGETLDVATHHQTRAETV